MMQSVQTAKERFLQGLPIEPGSLSEVILDSWKRSEEFGVVPGKADKSVLSAEQLQKRCLKRKDFYDVAIPVLENLYYFTIGSEFLLTISDEEGYILRAIGDEKITELMKENVFIEGGNRHERCIGTNAIGTALATRRPIQVFGPEHYYNQHHKWVCSGAPIFYPNGDIAGVFCLTGNPSNVSRHTLGMAVAAADSITRQLKMKETLDHLNVLQRDMKIIIETCPFGILLLNNALKVVRANTQAARYLIMAYDDLIDASILDTIGNDILEDFELKRGFSNRHLSIVRNGQTSQLSITLQVVNQEEYMILIERAETLHKKVNRIIGASASFTFEDIIGNSPLLETSLQNARTAAQNKANVLLTGESGTGKELFAQAIHNASDLREGPFVAINCGAIPRSLIESELFGYESGSFTGARRDGNAGKFEMANGGTIFLDEIGDMPLDVQSTLLRVLQNREISRIGSNKTIRINARVIAATNHNLLKAVENGTFRSDLFYRLNVINIHIPALRERIGDIRKLADYFFRKYSSELPNCSLRGLQEDAYEILEQYKWPGNIRELENAIERAVYFAKGELIGIEQFSFLTNYPELLDNGSEQIVEIENNPKSAGVEKSKNYSIRENEREQVENALILCRGNIKKAAALLEISRRTLYRKLEKYGISYDFARNK